MSKQTTKRSYSTVRTNTFKGIDCRTFSEEGTCMEMNNFRIVDQQIIEKREGYKWLMTLPGTPTATWRGNYEGDESIFVLIGNVIYCIEYQFDSFFIIGTVRETSTHACFFMIEDKLCLFNGTNIYSVSSSSGIKAIQGYVPLYGNGWSSGSVGEVYEPKNILSNHIRIRYVVKDMSRLIRFGQKAVSVDLIRYNSREYTAETIKEAGGQILEDMSGIEFTSMRYGDTVEVFLTVKHDTDLVAQLASCNRSEVFGNAGDTRAFCWSEKNKSAKMFYSKNPTVGEIEKYASVYPGTDKVYFPDTYILNFGDGGSPIKAACRYGDRLVVFTEESTWSADFSSTSKNEIRISPLCASVGCSGDGTAATNEDVLITVSSSGVYLLTKKTSTSICQIANISKPIEALLPEGFYTDAISIYDRERDECWFCLPYDTDGRVWVYNMSLNAWYTFTGIGATAFVLYDGKVGFFRDRKLFVFDPSLKADYDRVNASTRVYTIEASYVGKYSDFGSAERLKRLGRIYLSCKTDGGTVDLSAQDEHGNSVFASLRGTRSNSPEFYEIRTRSGRFRYLRMSISCPGNERQQIYSLSVTSKY